MTAPRNAKLADQIKVVIAQALERLQGLLIRQQA